MLPCQRALFDIPREVCFFNAATYSPLPHRGAGGGPRRRRAQGPAVETAGRFPAAAVRARAQGGGRADRRRFRRRLADPLGRLRRLDRRQGADDPARQPRAGAAGRPHLAGAGMDEPRRSRRLHGRDGEAAGRRRLDVGGDGRDRARRRRAAGAGLDLLGPLVGRRRARHGAHRHGGQGQGRGACWSTPRTMSASATST